MVENIIFWVFAVLAVGGALGVVFHRSVIYAALFLIVVFLSIAGFFVLNNADFLAVAQAIVYAVGLTIVLLFGIMFTGDRLFDDSAVTKKQLAAYILVGAFAFALLIPAAQYGYNVTPTPPELIAVLMEKGSTELLGTAIFTRYALPFEITSVLLLLAMIGAIVLSKKAFTSSHEALKYEIRGERHVRPEAQEALREKFYFESLGKEEGSGGESSDESEKVGV